MINFLDYDCFHYNLYQKNLDKNYIEIIHDHIFQTNTNHCKNIVYYHDEVTENHERSYENIVNYYYFKNNYKDINVILKKYIDVWENLESDFLIKKQFKLSHESYNNIKGEDWPSYDNYVKNIFLCSSNIVDEIKNFECIEKNQDEQTKILEIKKYINDTISKLQKRDLFLDSLDKNNTVIFVSSKIMHEYLKSKNFKCVLLPVSHTAINELMSLRNLNIKKNKNINQYSYFFLNRRFSRQREKTIHELNKNNLLTHGFVTQNALPFDSNDLKIKFKNVEYKNDLSVFERPYNLPNWKMTNSYNGIPCSNNITNILNISHNIHSLVEIVVESDLTENFITEKSFQAFLIRRIPLIISASGVNRYLIKQGFDLFEDLVDLSFDDIDDLDLKIETAIKNNAKLLSTYEITGLEKRLDNNLKLLLDKFPQEYFNKINKEINDLF